MPVYGTISSQFNNGGMNHLFKVIIDGINKKGFKKFVLKNKIKVEEGEKISIIPPKRIRYLSEIADKNREYNNWIKEQSEIAQTMYALDKSIQVLKKEFNAKSKLDYDNLNKIYNSKKNLLDPLNLKLLRIGMF